MLNHQEVVRILLKASPILISWADLENAILEQENAAENCSSKLSQETVDSLVILQVLYYVRNGGTANSYLAVADVASAQTLKRQVEEQATEIYLAYRLALPNLEYLLPSDSDDFKLLQAGIDGDKVACRQLALIFEDLGNEPAQQYWMNRSAFEFKIEYFSQTAESVAVTGDFDGWSQSCVLEKEDGLFTGTIDTLLDSIVFRFVVDGEWTTSDLYDTISVDGIINNYLKAEDSQAEEVSIAADKAVLGSVAELKYEERATELPESIAGEYSVVETITEIPPLEQTVALIKPDAYGAGRKDAIIERILEAGFNIALEAELIMSIEQAMEFYREHEGKSFYDNLINWMSSAPIYAMVLEKSDAIKAWRTLAGPTNSNIARETVPESIRALYGTDGSQNAVHGSDSKDSAAREKKVIFGESQHKVTDSDTADLNEEVFTLATEQVHIPGEFPEDIVQSIMERSEVEEEARLSHATSEASESLDIAVAVPTSPDTFEPNLPDNYGITETTTHTQRLLNYPGEQELKNSISGTEVQQLEEVAQNLESLTGEWVKFAADEAEEAIKLAKSIQRPLSPAQMKEIFQNVESLTGEPVNLSLEEVEATEKLISHTFETPERTNLPQVVDEDSNFAIDIEETIEAVEDPKLFEEMLVLDTEKKSLQKDVVEPINMIERPLSTAQVEEVIQNIESLMGEPVKLSSDEVEILKTNIDVINVDLNTKDFDQEAMEIAEAEIAAIVQSLSPPEVEKVVESADLEVIEVEQQKEDDLQRPVIPLDLSRPLSPAEVQEVIQNIQFFTGEIVSEAEVEAIQTSVENEEEIVIVPQILPLTSNKDVFSAEVEASELARTLESVAPEKLDAIEANSESEESEILTPAEIEEIQKSSRFVEAALKESLSEEQLNQFPDNLEKKNSDVLLEAIPAGVKDLTPLLNLHDKGNSSTSENGEKEDAITPEKLELVTSDQSNEILADGHQDDEMDKLGLQSFDEGDSHGDLMPMQPNTSRNFEFQAAANSGQLQSAETQVQEADVEITVPVNLKGKGAEDYKFTAIPPSYDEAVSVTSRKSNLNMDQSAKTSLPVELDTSPKADVNIDEDLPPPETAVTSNFRETVGNVAGVAHNNQTASSNFEHDEIIVTPSVAVTNNARAAFQTKQPSASTSMEIIPVSNKKPSAGKTQISANSTRCCGFF